jgi:peptidyl-prolyl cis-trans isomerase B (cyclophilin B)
MRVRALGYAAAAAGLALVTACGGSDEDPTVDQLTPGADATTSAAAGAAEGCTTPADLPTPEPKEFDGEPELTIEKATYTATIETNCGQIVVALDGKDAPRTVNSFAFLAGKSYFDDTICHRLTTAGIFVLQCGDPTATGAGGPGYELPDENLKGAKYPAGTVAMANAGPDTGGSQFFFVYDDTRLPPAYTPFGTITTGLDVLRNIAAAGSDDSNGPGDGAPVQPVVIGSFTVTKGAP